MQPDLELVAVRRDESFKAWSHGYPYRTVRWHFHPEYEIHLITATTGRMFVGDHIGAFAPGNLVMTGPNLPHNWVSDVPPDVTIEQRCLVLQFDADFIAQCIDTFPDLRELTALLDESRAGLLFPPATGETARPLLTALIDARGTRRVILFMQLLDLLAGCRARRRLASVAWRSEPNRYASSRINHVLAYLGEHFAQPQREAELAQLAGQSVSAFSRTFRRHTGLTFVQYVNRLRINLACELLATDTLSITEICYQCGFNNLSNFNRQFLLLKDMPPSKFRAYQQLNLQRAAGPPARRGDFGAHALR
jgi:AraC-like DNA-binding protein